MEAGKKGGGISEASVPPTKSSYTVYKKKEGTIPNDLEHSSCRHLCFIAHTTFGRLVKLFLNSIHVNLLANFLRMSPLRKILKVLMTPTVLESNLCSGHLN